MFSLGLLPVLILFSKLIFFLQQFNDNPLKKVKSQLDVK